MTSTGIKLAYIHDREAQQGHKNHIKENQWINCFADCTSISSVLETMAVSR